MLGSIAPQVRSESLQGSGQVLDSIAVQVRADYFQDTGQVLGSEAPEVRADDSRTSKDTYRYMLRIFSFIC